ncbi:MAG: Gfo/Idh/MocA family oxidoreductase [Saprospiraceae bacterium]|nr:Gfo/Idh/MocA family oxidoreductase [Saprospiraceae bacterium]
MINKKSLERRSFVKQSTLATGAVVLTPMVKNEYGFQSSVDETIKVSLIGCGGRGTGAAVQALKASKNVKLVALCDAFMDRVEDSLKNIQKAIGDGRADVLPEHQFDGFDGYKKAIELCDVVILTTPPGFRPMHFKEAVEKGKHVFMEKPVATDAPGIRSVLETAKQARLKKLNVVVGLQRHYQDKYLQLIDRIHKGKIGDIVAAQAYWNGAGVWVRPREAGQTEMEYQMRNWYYFNWLCGDHIVEQHIHNLDVVNWVKQGYPVKAQGMGGREVRKGPDHGQIFDHHYVEFEYADGTIMNSQCRHIKNCWSQVNEVVIGTKGKVNFGPGLMSGKGGKVIYQHDENGDPNPYQVEHDLLFAAIESGEYKYADTENGAKSTMTSILGRMATYSGKMVTWDEAIGSDVSLMPQQYAWDAIPPVVPDSSGNYPIPVPGATNVV